MSDKREPVTHELKTIQPYFDAVLAGYKNFEVRRNDRDFHVGDTLILREFAPPDKYGDRAIVVVVLYILYDTFPGVAPGWCVMGFNRMAIQRWPAPNDIPRGLFAVAKSSGGSEATCPHRVDSDGISCEFCTKKPEACDGEYDEVDNP